MTRRGNPDAARLQADRLAAVGCGVSDAVLIIGADRKVTWANDAAKAFYPGAKRGMVGRHCHEVIYDRRRPCDPADEICPLDTVRISGVTESFDKVLCDAQGNRAPCTLSTHPVLGPNGELIECVIVRKDKQARDDVWRIIQQQSDDLALVHTLTQMANLGTGLGDLLEHLSISVRAAFSCKYATIYLLDPSGERLQLMTPGVPAGIKKGIERILRAPLPPVVMPIDRAPLHRAALHSEAPVVIANREALLALMAEHTDNALIVKVLSPILRSIGMTCGVLVPLRVDQRPIGLMAVGGTSPLDDTELRRLTSLADQVATIASRAQLQAESQRVSERQALLLQAVAEGVLGLNRDAEVVFANASAASLLGRSQGQLHGMSFHALCGHQKADGTPCGDDCAVQAALRDRTAHYEVEGTLKAIDGDLRPVQLSAVPLDESELNLVITVRDISQQVHLRKQQQRNTERLRRSFSGTVAALRCLAEMRDPYTAGHERRVAQLARAIAQRMDLDEDVVDTVRLAATIHDIGKHAVPVEILTKPSKLSANELELIRTHSMVGWEILSEADFPAAIATIVRQHHERLDGSGYPDGITGDAITLEARIIAVADVVEAMASHRPYRASLGLEDALFEIQRHKGTHFDPQVVSACMRVFRNDGFDFE